ncbi:MAG: RNA polymerase sigma factor [Myxococcales bacterium]
MPHAARPEASGGPLDPARLYESEGEYVWNSLRRLGVPPSDLEDLTHETFVVAFRRLPSFDPSRPIRAWLFGIAAKVAGHHRRWRLRRREVSGDLPELETEEQGPHEALDERQRRALLVHALSQVKLERRAVLILHEIDGIAIPEVARALGIPLNTAYSRLRVGRAELAEAVRRAFAQGGKNE